MEIVIRNNTTIRNQTTMNQLSLNVPYEKQIPGEQFFNESNSTNQAQSPGGAFVDGV